MMEYYNWIKDLAFTGEIGMYTYWLPMILCAVGYSVRTFKQIQHIKVYHIDKHAGYVEDLTVGTVLWRVLLTVTPIVNIFALSFSLLSDMVSTVLNWLASILEFKLVQK